MIDSKYKHTKALYLYLMVFFLFVTFFAPFVYLFNFQFGYSYQLFIFVIVVVNITALALLSISELISLSFDRTANKNTLFATIAILCSYLLSNDFIFLLNYLNVVVPHEVVVVMHIFSHLFRLLSVVFFLRFYKENYGIKVEWKIVSICLGIFVVCNIFFNIFDIFYALLGLLVVESASVLVMVYRYKSLLNNKYNNYAGIVTLLICFTLFIADIFSLFYGRERSFIGTSALYYVLIFSIYITIYIDFLIKKTLSSYSYEDEKNKELEKKTHVMVVSCFHCFDCTYDDKHIDFSSKKAKELFALLVILRGKTLSIEKAITYLWPDKDMDKSKLLYRNAVMKLRQCFKEINCPYLSFKRGEIQLDITNIVCDYYDVVDGKKEYSEEPLLPEYEWSLEFENILK